MSRLDLSAVEEGALPPAPAVSETAMTGRERVVLAVLLTASFTLAVDFSILNVALPEIGADVGFSLHNLQWIASAFALCAAGFTLTFGRVADLFGRRRLFLIGIALLGASSLAGGLATTPGVLLGARVAQGLATAIVTPAALSLLTTVFSEGPRRDRALGLNGALMAAGFTTGAIAGGLLTDLLSWRWAFYVNVGVAAAVLVVAPVVLRESRPVQRPRLDLPGAVAVTVGLLAVVYGLTTAGAESWTDPKALVALVGGLACLVAFYAIEKGASEPLVPVGLLRRRSVAWGNVAGVVAFATETSLVFLLTLYLQDVLGFSALEAGLTFSVLGAGTVIGGVLGPRVIAARGARGAVVGGLCVQAVATAPLLLLDTTSDRMWLLLLSTFLGGVANLVAIVGFMVTVTGGVPDDEQGLVTGLATMSQQIGITMGIPVMSAIATTTMGSAAGGTDQVLLGIRTAIGIDVLVALACAVLVAVFHRPGRVRGRRATGGAA